MITFLYVIFLSAILAGIGWSLVGRLDRANRLTDAERLPVSFTLGAYAIYFGVFIIGPFRLDGVSMWGLIGVCFAAAVPGWRRMPWRRFGKAMHGAFLASETNAWTRFLWVAVALIGLTSFLQGMAPPNDFDSLLYHMMFPQYDVEVGRLEIPWDRKVGAELYPALASHLTRLTLVTMNDGAAQMMHGVFGLIAAAGAGLILVRLGFSVTAGTLAAIFFISIRVVVWEMGTVEVDVPLAAYMVMAALVYTALRGHGGIGLGVLFGLMVGGGLLVKYYGFPVALSFAPVILFDLMRRHLKFSEIFIGPMISLAAIIPHMTRSYLITGNPVFPIYDPFFHPGRLDFFGDQTEAFGTGRGFLDVITTPWNMFIQPMHYFDGMIFGAPYLLIFCPLILLRPEMAKKLLPLIWITVTYYLLWFYIGGQQVRFLLPIMPFLAAAAALGICLLWDSVADKPVFKTAFAGIIFVVAINQAAFVGIYSALRLPVALGFMNAATYHKNTPTLNGAFYQTCNYLRDKLKQGERYFSSINPLSYYCPQKAAINNYFADEAKWWLETSVPPTMTIQEFIGRAENLNIRYFIAPTFHENRRNNTAKITRTKTDWGPRRFGKYFGPVFESLESLSEGPFTAVYDGRAVIAKLRARHLDK